jgi:hypothetical protein
MSIQSELANMYELMLRKGASEDTARAVATALCRELVSDNDDVANREGVSRAIATTVIARATSRDAESLGAQPRPLNKRVSGHQHFPTLSDFLADDGSLPG